MIGDDYEAVRALDAWRRLHDAPRLPPAPVRVAQEVWLSELWPGGPCFTVAQMCMWSWPLDIGPALGGFERDLAAFLRAYTQDALIDLGTTMLEWKRKAERLQPPSLLTGRWRAADPDERVE